MPNWSLMENVITWQSFNIYVYTHILYTLGKAEVTHKLNLSVQKYTTIPFFWPPHPPIMFIQSLTPSYSPYQLNLINRSQTVKGWDPSKQKFRGSEGQQAPFISICESHFSTHQGSWPGNQSCVAELMAGRWGGVTAASWTESSSGWGRGILGTSLGAPAARWERGGEGWREARQALAAP